MCFYSNYQRINDSDVKGWETESNIYWNKNIFGLVDYGFSNLKMVDYPNRGLFWARLCCKAKPDMKLFVCTAHFPWKGCPEEVRSGRDQRRAAVANMCVSLRQTLDIHSSSTDAVVFGGDLNDDWLPVQVLNEQLALEEVFEQLDCPAPVTHPVRPSLPSEERLADHTYDWIMTYFPYNGGRVVAAYVKSVRGLYPPPSDHKPVIAVIELRGAGSHA